MIGIIMAGGQGTRLYPLTANKPKPLVEVLGKPVIEYVKDALVAAGTSQIILTTGYKGDKLEKLVSDWNENQNNIMFSVNKENQPMGTAGSIKLLENRLHKTFIVGSGDSILSSDISKLIQSHKSSNAKVTMALWKVEDPTQFGIVGLSNDFGGDLDSDLTEGYICKFLEKPSKKDAFSNVINAGLYVIEPEVLEHIPQGEKYDFSKQLFPKLLELKWPIYGVTLDGVWFDVGTPNELIKSQNHLIKHSGNLPFTMPLGKIIDEDSFIFNGAKSESELVNSVICQDVKVGLDSNIVHSMLMKGTTVGNNSPITNSVVGNNVEIGNNCRINGCVIGDNVVIADSSNLIDMKIAS